MPLSRKVTDPPKNVLSTKAAAAALGVSESRIRQAVRSGRLKTAGRIGTQHAIRPRDLEAYRRWAAQQDNNGPRLPPGYLAPADVARELGVTQSRVRQLIEEGNLRAERFGRRWGIRPQALAAYRGDPPPAARAEKLVQNSPGPEHEPPLRRANASAIKRS